MPGEQFPRHNQTSNFFIMSNDFSNLNAQSSASALAMTTPEEFDSSAYGVFAYATEETEETSNVSAPAGRFIPSQSRGLNVQKFTLHNLTVPYSKRISRQALEAKLATARHRGSIMALYGQIKSEVEPLIAELRRQEELIENFCK